MNPAARDLQRLKDNPKFGFVAALAGAPDCSLARHWRAAETRSSKRRRREPAAGPAACESHLDGHRPQTMPRIMADGAARSCSTCPTAACSARHPRLRKSKYDPEGARAAGRSRLPQRLRTDAASSTNDATSMAAVAQAVAQYHSPRRHQDQRRRHDRLRSASPSAPEARFASSMGGWPAERE